MPLASPLAPVANGITSIVKTHERRPPTAFESLWMLLGSALLFAPYLLAAKLKGGPGIGVHLGCMLKGVRLVLKKPARHHARWIYYPLDSTRYVELDFVVRNGGKFKNWLDISSPRQIPALLLPRNPGATTTLLNPDAADIAETKQMAELLGLNCTFVNATADAFQPATQFDLISCVSVLEHIPDDSGTMKKIWSMLAPGGRFILTVPAAAQGGRQLMDQDPYGLNLKVEGGYFFQRFYSDAQLKELQQITGAPKSVEVWGERTQGWLQANLDLKRRSTVYPVWRVPYDIACNWKRFASVDELPGEGAYCAVFTKNV